MIDLYGVIFCNGIAWLHPFLISFSCRCLIISRVLPVLEESSSMIIDISMLQMLELSSLQLSISLSLPDKGTKQAINSGKGNWTPSYVALQNGPRPLWALTPVSLTSPRELNEGPDRVAGITAGEYPRHPELPLPPVESRQHWICAQKHHRGLRIRVYGQCDWLGEKKRTITHSAAGGISDKSRYSVACRTSLCKVPTNDRNDGHMS